MKRLIIVGSPRTSGRSAHLAEMLFEANIDEHPEDELFLVPVSEVEIGPCIGCNACREKSNVILRGDDGKEVTVQRHRCVFDDDMQALYDLVDDADQLTIVSPVYFSGAPASLKCLLDRLQPYFWASKRGKVTDDAHEGSGEVPVEAAGERIGEGSGRKRPAELHVIGEGGDPHGYDALVSEVRSALAVAGFRLGRVLDWVGKIDAEGEIIAEAAETLAEQNDAAASDGVPIAGTSLPRNASGTHSPDNPDSRSGKKQRPKLDLHSNKGKPSKGQSAKGKPAKGQPAKKKGSKRGAE